LEPRMAAAAKSAASIMTLAPKAHMKRYRVLFLCTGNSARSIMAEAIVNHRFGTRFRAFSAGSHPRAEIHPLTVETLRANRYPTDELRSKSWDEFAGPDAPQMDFVFTVCDQAAGEACPVWPGDPVTAHWGISDPVAIEDGLEVRRAAFARAFWELFRRIELLASLRLEALDRLAMERKVREIGAATPHKSR
jgi:arsenate reductase (thioredoxin)